MASGTVRVENRLGAAVQLCTLPWLGWISDDLTGCPSAPVSRLGALLGLAPDVLPELLASYGGWEGRTSARSSRTGALYTARLASLR